MITGGILNIRFSRAQSQYVTQTQKHVKAYRDEFYSHAYKHSTKKVNFKDAATLKN